MVVLVALGSDIGVLVTVGMMVGAEEGVGLSICPDPQACKNKHSNSKGHMIGICVFFNLPSDNPIST